MSIFLSLVGLVSASTPAPPIVFRLDVNHDVQASAFEELHGPFSYILEIGVSRSDDVDDA
jgi:hypothetical protein